MEPVLDDAGQPVSGVRYVTDAEGALIRSHLWRGHYVPGMPNVQARLDRLVSEFAARPDDVFIYAYQKCGTHWVNEICQFLLTGQAERRPPPKELGMLEHTDMEELDRIPAPRVLNCHLRCSIMPESLMPAHCRIIYVVRNPKDTAVSLYHHETGMHQLNYNGSFRGFLGLFEKGSLEGGSWFEHTRDFLTALDSRPNMLMVEYERLKRDPAGEIARIARYLLGDRGVSEQLLAAICEKVSFASMRKDRGADGREFFKDGLSFYRKGEVGDWKGYFDAESSLRVDRLCARALEGFEHLYQPIYE